jgi:dihydroxyacetone kinase-like protein
VKKLINNPSRYVDEMLDGLCAAYPTLVRDPVNARVVRHRTPVSQRVGVVTGGGSGHLPLFVGYVGRGLVDACAVGDVFEGPTVDTCRQAIEVADGGRGVLCLFGNYGGDRMNFDIARELSARETETVLGTDDVASGSRDEIERRRGVAGIVFAYKAAGAKALAGAPLADVVEAARNAVARTRTIGVALSPCRLPGNASASFSIGADEMEFGMGIHGEPGIQRMPLASADAVADLMLDRLLAERPAVPESRVAVLVNGLGATPLEELFILYRRVAARLKGAALDVAVSMVGNYVTSMEMAGVSLSLAFLDDALESHLSAPASCPFWSVA